MFTDKEKSFYKAIILRAYLLHKNSCRHYFFEFRSRTQSPLRITDRPKESRFYALSPFALGTALHESRDFTTDYNLCNFLVPRNPKSEILVQLR